MNQNFTNYIKKRNLSEAVFTNLINRGLVKVEEDGFVMAMKSLDGEILGWQRYFFIPKIIDNKVQKTQALHGSKIGYFFDEIDLKKPLALCEGNPDFLSIPAGINKIGLQSVQGLGKLVEELIKKGVPEILLVIDNDEPADKAISTILETAKDFLSILFDCRECFQNFKDLNDFLVAGGTITFEAISDHKRSLQEFVDIKKSFVQINGKGGMRIIHKNISLYLKKKLQLESTNKNLFSYDSKSGIRKPISPEKVCSIINKYLQLVIPSDLIFNSKDVKEILEQIKINAYSEDLENGLSIINHHDINLDDGIYNVLDKTLRPYSPAEYKQHKLPYHSSLLKEQKKPEAFLEFLHTSLGDYPLEERTAIIEFLREYIANLFIPNVEFQKGLFLRGVAGAGKGTILYVLQELLNKENISNIGTHNLSNPDKISALLGKLVNIDSEMKDGTEFGHSIKQITSGDRIEGRFLYKDTFFFSPYARLIIASNSVGSIRNPGDGAISRRFIFIHFRRSFVGKEDFNLKDKLIKDLDLIFSWAIQVLPVLLERGRFNIPEILLNETKEEIRQQNPVALFVEERLLSSPGSKIYNDALYRAYESFRKDSGEAPIAKNMLGRKLSELGLIIKKSGSRRYLLDYQIKREIDIEDVVDGTDGTELL